MTTMDIYAQEIPASVQEMVTQDEAAVLALSAPKSNGKKWAKPAGKSAWAPKLLPDHNRGQGVSNA